MPERACLWLAVLLQQGLLMLPLLLRADSLLSALASPQVVLVLALAGYFLVAEGTASQDAWQGTAPAAATDLTAYLSSMGLLAVMLLAIMDSRATGIALLLSGFALAVAGIKLRIAAIRSLKHCFVSQTGLLRGHL